jgi:hypothetical protein
MYELPIRLAGDANNAISAILDCQLLNNLQLQIRSFLRESL